MVSLRSILLLTLVYLALTANLQPLNILTGILLAVGITAVLPHPRQKLRWRRLPGMVLASLRYAFILLYDLLASGIQVARIVLSPKMPLRPGIIAIPSGCTNETAVALSAHAITLTPGEMVVEIDDAGVMYTHMLDVADAEQDILAAQKMRRELLQKIL